MTVGLYAYNGSWVKYGTAFIPPFTTSVTTSGNHTFSTTVTMTCSTALGSGGYFGVGIDSTYHTGDAINALTSVAWSVQSGATTVTAAPSGETCIATISPV
jgi:hypothetical protein